LANVEKGVAPPSVVPTKGVIAFEDADFGQKARIEDLPGEEHAVTASNDGLGTQAV
jgi:hypothetical protein